MSTWRTRTQELTARWRLRYQVLILLVGLLAVSLVGLYQFSSNRLSEAARVTAQRWAEALAETAAGGSAEHLALRDYGGLESSLRSIVALPGVLRIDVVDESGRPLLSVFSTREASVAVASKEGPEQLRVEYRPRDVPRPTGGRSTQLDRWAGAEVLRVWVPVQGDASLGMVGVTFSQESERTTLVRLQRESILAIVVVAALTIPILYVFLSRTMRPLQRLAEFSRGLGTDAGRRLTHAAGSLEVAELTQALNDASLRLRGQLDELRASEGRTMTALEALAERTARLNVVFDLSPDGFALFDGKGSLAFCNPALVQMTGWEDLTRVPHLSLAEFDRHFATLCGSKHPYVPVQDQATGTAPVTLVLERPAPRMLARVFRRSAGVEGGSILYFRDVTHEMEVDRIKSEFLTSAAHEFRTPLASIMGFSELLLRRDYDAGQQAELLGIINRQSRLLTGLVNELLDLARIEARGGKDFDLLPRALDGIIHAAVKALPLEGTAHTLQVSTAGPLPEVLVDGDKLQQALSNVLSNAIKYSPAGGLVEVGTAWRRGAEGEFAGITVRDQGIGMDAAQAARAFERFYRADTTGKIPGTGLGLSLVKEIMDIHRGSVELQSVPGVGTTVTLWLPVPGSIWPQAHPAP